MLNQKMIDDNYIKSTKWTQIPEFEGYFISEDGKILSKRNNNQVLLTPNISSKKYYVNMVQNGKGRRYPLAFLIAEMFINNPEKYEFIIYKDGDTLNININNLEWSNNPYNSKEKWKSLDNFEKYEISETGIRNFRTKRELKPSSSGNRYPSINLFSTDNKPKGKYMHVLLAENYISNPNDLPQVNHKNGIKKDFGLKNLEWMTQKENSQHAVDTGLQPIVYDKGRHVELLDENYDVIEIFTSVKNAKTYIGCNATTIYDHFRKNKFNDGTALINNYRIRYKIHKSLDGEIWKSVNTKIDEIDSIYEASSLGRIRNSKTTHILSPHIKDNYLRIGLRNSSISDNEHFYVNRLVAFAFLDFNGKQSDYEVNHKNKNTGDNNIINLEILIRKEHAIIDHGKPILVVSNTLKYMVFRSHSEAAEILSLKRNNISMSINRDTNTFKFKCYDLNSQKAQEIIKRKNLETKDVDEMYDVKNEFPPEKFDHDVEIFKTLDDLKNSRRDNGKAVVGLHKKFKYVIFYSSALAAESLIIKSYNISKSISGSRRAGEYKWYFADSEEAKNIIHKYERDVTIKEQLVINKYDKICTTNITNPEIKLTRLKINILNKPVIKDVNDLNISINNTQNIQSKLPQRTDMSKPEISERTNMLKPNNLLIMNVLKPDNLQRTNTNNPKIEFIGKTSIPESDNPQRINVHNSTDQLRVNIPDPRTEHLQRTSIPKPKISIPLPKKI